ncbi:MAG TPA: hypothetical protein VG937_02170 [Polyangiaceae bacterium]|nr:hypothetical protein [Polyangiaceae bacterium]
MRPPRTCVDSTVTGGLLSASTGPEQVEQSSTQFTTEEPHAG